MAAHRALFKDQVFRDFVLPSQARLLTQKTIAALMPLFEHNPSPYDNGERVCTISESDENRLVVAFTQAMMLRWQISLCEDKFEYCFPSHGSPFCADSMTDAQGSIMPRQTSSQSVIAKVHMTLVPGLQRKTSVGQDVDYMGLACVDGTLRTGSVRFTGAKVILRHDRP